MIDPPMSRRRALAALASTAVLPLGTGCRGEPAASTPASTPDADARALLDQLADDLLRLSPEGATSLGIDTGARASLRSQLGDRSAAGQQRIADPLRADLQPRQALQLHR